MKRRIIKALSLILVVCTLLSAAGISASALSWDGSSQGGGGNTTSAGPNGYAIRTDADNCIGYRFSVVDKQGNLKGTKVIDVFRNTSYGNMEYSSAYKFSIKYNKKQLITNQNYGFSTGKNTTNCYKEADMGFAAALPAPSGMSVWQNDGRNLNPILLTLGINKIAALKNGDKVLVEPLYDLRLESVYHAVTVTETAIYGKYILGASSDGGASGNSGSWGFISSYTNRHYPNELFTPDGQGLWTGVAALSKRATFYDIINKGYGVGIAYTETKSDFTPSLTVRCVEAWPGNKGNRQNHYGISYGSAFGNYVYANGYPIMGDKVWFAVNFPAESENCYVRQTVWVDGGGSASRQVYSNSGTWYDVALSPTTVDAGRSAYIVKARVDWIDANGNVLKWGAEKTFYIPVRPKINQYRVAAVDITGKVAAYNGSGGKSGMLYVGQRIYANYTFTSSNTWTSYNNLYTDRFEWKNGAWSATADNAVTDAALSSAASKAFTSRLGFYRVPDNSLGTNERKCVPYRLRNAWSSDAARTAQNSWIELPVVKADVELADIRLVDENGYYISGKNVWENQLVTPQYLYKNNTDCTVYVNGYNSDTTQMSGVYAIPANGQITVNGKQLRVGHTGSFSVWGGVYLEGAGRSTSWEKTDFESQNNNHWLRVWTVQNPLTIDVITPNSSYREGIEVITSFTVKNASATAFIPTDGVVVNFTVKNGTTTYSSQQKATVIPGKSSNLVYFRWTVPKGMNGATLIINGTVVYNGNNKDSSTLTRIPISIYDSQTPDTAYESAKPSGWTASALPAETANTASWSIWTHSNGIFTKLNYGVRLSIHGLTIQPDSNSPSAEETKKGWNMKSGYGFTLNWSPSKKTTQGSSIAMSLMTTQVQSGYVMYPEYNYSAAYGKHSTLRLASSVFSLKANTAAEGNSPVHFIPVWYPNGSQNYAVSAYAYDCWTPAGMIGARASSNALNIVGSLYDDYYVGR